MDIQFDAAKNEANIAKHGVSLALAGELEWETALVREDARHDYGETRWTAIGYVGARLYVVVYVERDGAMRIVRRRKANSREVKSYAET